MMDEAKASIMIACPAYNGMIESETALALYANATERYRCHVLVRSSSLLPSNCTTLLLQGVNNRDKFGIEWFAMLHGDVIPKGPWLDTLIDEAEKHDADFMSACVPIKDTRGLTSTAIGPEWNGPAWGRLSMKQLHREGFPRTFTAIQAVDALGLQPPERPFLYANTGCMVFRLSKWNPDIHFVQTNSIVQNESGEWSVLDFSEDWYFSLQCARSGLKVMSTTAVEVDHKGQARYPSYENWGNVENEFEFSRQYV